MDTLSKHNSDILKEFAKAPNVGVACDICNTELKFAVDVSQDFPPAKNDFLLLSRPPKRKVYCPICQTFDYVLMPNFPVT